MARIRSITSVQGATQLTQAKASSWEFKGEEKLAGPNLVGTVVVASKFWTPSAIEPVAHKYKGSYDRLDWGPGAKTIWGRSISKILPLMNDQPRLDDFSPAEIILECVPKWKVTHGKAQEVILSITHGAMQEAEQRKVEDIEERPERSRSKRMIDEKGRNTELLWFHQYRKIIRDMKGTHRPPDRISRAKGNHLSLSIF